MSWQGYIDNLIATKTMTHCGIFGLDGSTWASTASFPLAADTIKTVLASVSDSSKVAKDGLQVTDGRYIFVRNDPGVYTILKKGASGIVVYKSSQSAIIAVHDETVKSEAALTSVGRVIDYLSKHGY